ncbi:hypothetical protein ACQ4PT_003333 [Festuca glaucescens]
MAAAAAAAAAANASRQDERRPLQLQMSAPYYPYYPYPLRRQQSYRAHPPPSSPPPPPPPTSPPPPPPSSPPPPRLPAPRRSAPGCSLCFFLKVIVVIVVVLGALTTVLWLILRPVAVRATAVSATLSRFDLADGPAAGGQLLQYNLTMGISLRNPNRFHIHYDYAEAQASYDGERFGYDPVEPFYLERKSERTVTAAFGGSSLVDDGGALRTYRRERSDGFYYVNVRLYSDLGFKVRVFNTRRKSKISCKLRLPVPSTSATPVTTQLGTRCSVDF